MKISYVNNHYQLGGAETVVRQLHEGILARGHISRLHVTEGKSWPRIPGLKPLYPRILAKLDHSRAHSFIQKFAPRHTWTDRSFRNLAAADSDIIHLHSYITAHMRHWIVSPIWPKLNPLSGPSMDTGG